jgi:hypothetical protein
MRDITLKVRMSAEERARLATLARREETSESEVVRRLVKAEAGDPDPLMARLLEAVEAGDRVGEESALRALNARARARRKTG